MNTQDYHTIVRRRKNKIRMLGDDNGGMVENDNDIKKFAINFYKMTKTPFQSLIDHKCAISVLDRSNILF